MRFPPEPHTRTQRLPDLGGILGREDLEVVPVANRRAGLDANRDPHWSAFGRTLAFSVIVPEDNACRDNSPRHTP